MPRNILRAVDLFVAISDEPAKRLQKYCELLGEEAPKLEPPADVDQHRAMAWCTISASARSLLNDFLAGGRELHQTMQVRWDAAAVLVGQAFQETGRQRGRQAAP